MKEYFDKVCERPFDPETTMGQLEDFGGEKFLEWGVDKRVCVLTNNKEERVGIILKINHPNYCDMLLITLSYLDLYSVRFLNMELEEVMKGIDGLYCDQLFECIDRKINSNVRVTIDLCLN